MCLFHHYQYACSCIGEYYIKEQDRCPDFEQHRDIYTKQDSASSKLGSDYDFCCSQYCCAQRIVQVIKEKHSNIEAPKYDAVLKMLVALDGRKMGDLAIMDASHVYSAVFMEHMRCEKGREGTDTEATLLDEGFAGHVTSLGKKLNHEDALREAVADDEL